MLKIDQLKIWEILVPVTNNKGHAYDKETHQAWDFTVCKLSGGLTILPPHKGAFVDGFGGMVREQMIPVRIACSREQIDQIAAFTLDYYKQECVMVRQGDTVLLYRLVDDIPPELKPDGLEKWQQDILDMDLANIRQFGAPATEYILRKLTKEN